MGLNKRQLVRETGPSSSPSVLYRWRVSHSLLGLDVRPNDGSRRVVCRCMQPLGSPSSCHPLHALTSHSLWPIVWHLPACTKWNPLLREQLLLKARLGQIVDLYVCKKFGPSIPWLYIVPLYHYLMPISCQDCKVLLFTSLLM